MTNSISTILRKAESNGFEIYGSFNEGEDLQHEILTCKKGEYNGEVIDIYYDFYSGNVSKIEHSTQFKDQLPKFNLN